MNARVIEQLLVNIGQITNLSKSLNINKEAIDYHLSNKREAEKRLERYTEQYKNEEYMRTLSPPEKKCLMDNAQNVHMVHQSIIRELDYLDLNKQPLFILHSIAELEHVYLYLEYLLNLVGKNGETILPHLQAIKVKHFDKANYKNQINSLYSELEALTWDYHQDTFVERVNLDEKYVPVFEHLAVATMWLQKEKERLEVEALPEIKKLEIPAETTPEIPKAPEHATPEETITK